MAGLKARLKDSNNSFCKLLVAARERAGMTQRELAEGIGFETFTSVGLWERGIQIPSPQKMRLLCKQLKLNESEMFNYLLEARLEEIRTTLMKDFKEAGFKISGNRVE